MAKNTARGLVVTVLVVAIIAVVWFINAVAIPASWPLPQTPVAWHAIDGSGASVTLNGDGTGMFRNIPHGKGDACVNGDYEFLNGTFTWKRTAEGRFEARQGDSTIFLGVVWDDGEHELRWYELGLYICEKQVSTLVGGAKARPYRTGGQYSLTSTDVTFSHDRT